MGNTLATMRGAEASTKANRKRDLWKRIRRDIQRAGLTQAQADSLAKTLRMDLEELIEIASVEQYVCGHHDGMQKQRSISNAKD